MENDLPTRLERLHAVLYSRPESVLTEAAAILRSLPSQSQPDPLQLLADEAQELGMGYGGQPQGNVPTMSQFASKEDYENATSNLRGNNEKDYEQKEREHFGDPDKRTGIYASPANVQQDEREAALARWDSRGMDRGIDSRKDCYVIGWKDRANLAAPAIPTWISVEERLPENGQAVLAYRPLASASGDPELTITFYRGEHYNNESPQGVKHGFDCWCHPSHWMPLPAAPIPADPKEEGK